MPTYTWTPSVLGSLIAILVIIVSVVFFITGQLDGKLAALFVACGLTRLL